MYNTVFAAGPCHHPPNNNNNNNNNNITTTTTTTTTTTNITTGLSTMPNRGASQRSLNTARRRSGT